MGASAKPQDNSSETSGLDIDLDPSYVPSDDEPFMNEKQLKFFERQLMDWKNSILAEAQGTLNQLQDGPIREPDLNDRASSETDWSIELRTRDRQRKLISKIDAALRRISEGEYGYCQVTGDLARPPPRPSDRDDDAGSAGTARTAGTGFARRLRSSAFRVNLSIMLAFLVNGCFV
jgi:DnaK suppressor protein